jgi:fibronectin type 3 domain-containing protein
MNSTFRNWLILYLQSRRRNRAAGQPSVPAAPTDLDAIDTGTLIYLSWVDHSSDETGFRIYRKVNGGSYSLYQSLAANTSDYEDTNVSVGNNYTYYVVAYNANGESAHSNEVSLTFGA